MSKAAQQTRILPNLHSSSLISLGQLADDGCVSILDKTHLYVIHENETIQAIKNTVQQSSPLLTGKRNKQDGLYDIPIYEPNFPREKTTLQPYNHKMPQLKGLCTTTTFPVPNALHPKSLAI